MEKDYQELIHYSLCESLYDNMRKLTNYTTFTNMCSNIKDYINSDFPIPSELYKLTMTSVNEISELYGINKNESTEHMLNFFKEEIYLKYYKIVNVIKTNCKNSHHT